MRSVSLPRAARAAFVVIATGVFTQACEHDILAPVTSTQAPTPRVSGDTAISVTIANVHCQGNLAERKIACAEPTPQGPASQLIIGGQGTYVRLTSSNVDYQSSTQRFSFNVTLRNLIPQTLGSSDGTTLDPNGIRVFFSQGPTVTAGTSVVSVFNPDGIGTFTAANQPYFQYSQMIAQDAVSSSKTWVLAMLPTVTAFEFDVLVSAPVQYPNGYVLLGVGNTTIRADGVRQVSSSSKTAVGNTVSGTTIAFTSSDTTVAVVNSSGLVSGVREGPVTISASDGSRPGTLGLNITAITRVWSAGALTTDPSNKLNWSRQVTPTANDSLDVPVVASAIYPALTANLSTAGVIVEPNASLSVGPFSLTINKSFTVGTGSTLPTATGTIFLAGTNEFINTNAVRTPKLRVTGRYALSSNLTATGVIRVDGGKLTSSGYRIRVDGY
jgi:hypothetical protein